MSWESDLETKIENSYRNSGNQLGWRFLYSGTEVLDGATVALIGLQPGGNAKHADHGEFSMPTGKSAFRDERWKAMPPGKERLQQQVLALFRRIGVAPEKVLAGNLVPFRSPSWSDLPNKGEAISLGSEIWNEVLHRVRPELIVALGSETGKAIAALLDVNDRRTVSVGWGTVTATKYNHKWGRLVQLPHLSRFPIITRAESREAVNTLFDVSA